MRWRSGMLGLTLFGAAVAQAAGPVDGPGAGPTAPAGTSAADEEPWPMSLTEAIRIALHDSEIVRVLHTGALTGPTVIERVEADMPPARFRVEATALVRSVEQQYWVVAAQGARVASLERAARTTRAIYEKYVETELPQRGRGSILDIAEAAEMLSRIDDDPKVEAEKLAGADRQLRLILGLRPADGRRIVTATRPIDRPVASDPREEDLLVDAGYRRYKEARRRRLEADRQLEAGCADHEKDRITIGKYFEVIRRHAGAVAAEADAASEYNTSIAATGEARGTLLADRFILVVEPPSKGPRNQADEAAKKASNAIW